MCNTNYKEDNMKIKNIIYTICIVITLGTGFACKSLATTPDFRNFSEVFLLSDIPPFSIDNPQIDNAARQWYFEPYTTIIPNLTTYSGYYISDGELLVAHTLVGNKTTKGTIIMIGGYNSTPLVSSFQYFAQQFILEGFRVILLDVPGHGFSGGQRGDISSYKKYGNMIADFLVLTDGQLGDQIVMIGISVGAIAIYDAYIHNEQLMKQVNTSVLMSPFYDLKNSNLYLIGSKIVSGIYIEKEKSPLQISQLSGNWIKEQRKWTAQLNDYPILNKKLLLVFGEQDEVIKYEKSRDFFNGKINNADYKIYPNQDHVFSNDGYKTVRTEIVDWVFSYLSK